jgi:hypothetical protein
MFSALMLACLVETGVCKSAVSPILYDTEISCQTSLVIGIRIAEQQGWTVVGYHCYDWGSKV